jgi:predicted amidophosphoribosyltransferase
VTESRSARHPGRRPAPHDALDRALRPVREAVLDAWALIQPIECLGCGRPDRALCEECRPELAPLDARRVRCDAGVPVPVWCAADYDGAVRSAIIALKEHGRTDAARPLGGILAAAAAAALAGLARAPLDGPPALELAWVPSTPSALRRRGYDPVAEVVRAARLPSSRVLAARGRREQKRLGRLARLADDDARFRVRGMIGGRRFILVDDVVTTGATLAAAASTIAAAGGTVLAAVAVAAPDLGRRTIARSSERRPGGS